MKITKINMMEDDEVLSEDAEEIIVEIENRMFILRQRVDGVLLLITPEGGFVQKPPEGYLEDSGFPVRRTYFESVGRGSLMIYQKVFDEEEPNQQETQEEN